MHQTSNIELIVQNFKRLSQLFCQVLLCSEEADLVFNKFLTTLSKEWDFKEDFEVSY